jgi:hypothetical protein
MSVPARVTSSTPRDMVDEADDRGTTFDSLPDEVKLLIIKHAAVDSPLILQTSEKDHFNLVIRSLPSSGSCTNLLLVNHFFRKQTLEAISRHGPVSFALEYDRESSECMWTYLPCKLLEIDAFILSARPKKSDAARLVNPTEEMLQIEVEFFFQHAWSFSLPVFPARRVKTIVLRSQLYGDLAGKDVRLIESKIWEWKPYILKHILYDYSLMPQFVFEFADGARWVADFRQDTLTFGSAKDQ